MNALSLPSATDGFDYYLQQISHFDLLSKEQEYELARRYRQRGELDAAHRLICANLRFVVKIAMEYRGYGLRLADLVQEGNIGLMMAVRKFDPERGTRLISYAVWWIRAYIHNFIIRSWSLVKIGTTQAQRKLFFKLGQTRARLLGASGHAEVSSIAQELEVHDEEVEEMALRMGAPEASLDVELSEGSDYTLLDTLADERANQEESLSRREQSKLVRQRVSGALATLSPREHEVIEARILRDEPLTLQEIADGYGISRERVRQIESQALRKLRAHLGENAEPHGTAKHVVNK